MASSFTESFKVRSFDTDPLGRLRLSALIRHMQNAADGHARLHNLAVDQLRECGKTWVLREFHCEMDHGASHLDQCEVSTWASARSAGARAWRDYVIHSASGHRVAAGSSLWLMLDTNRWRPQRLSPDVLEMVDASRPCPIEITAFANGAALADESNGSESQKLSTRRYEVHWLDLDNNGHVSNVRYVDWILATVADCDWQFAEPWALSMEFLYEAKLGDFLEVRLGAARAGRQKAEIWNQRNERIARAALRWRRRGEV